uniref:Uncharacterized protein n=1 Tax=Spongospora subterranea TaxID=70186 RepID=A0A0H5QQZ9_9EUKA|eukprot:CRZ04062.1 hypothetical protein [Spongospora subterranea]
MMTSLSSKYAGLTEACDVRQLRTVVRSIGEEDYAQSVMRMSTSGKRDMWSIAEDSVSNSAQSGSCTGQIGTLRVLPFSVRNLATIGLRTLAKGFGKIHLQLYAPSRCIRFNQQALEFIF